MVLGATGDDTQTDATADSKNTKAPRAVTCIDCGCQWAGGMSLMSLIERGGPGSPHSCPQSSTNARLGVCRPRMGGFLEVGGWLLASMILVFVIYR